MNESSRSVESAGASFLSFPGTLLLAAAFYLVRLSERLMPRRLFATLLWPVLGVLALFHFAKWRKLRAAWEHFPRRWRPRRVSFFLQQMVGMSHARLVYTWPDRLSEVHWRSRCEVRGGVDLERLQASERPVIFVSLHFGPFETLPYWLRALGFPVTALVGRQAPRQWLKRRQYALSAPADVPVVVPVTDQPRLRRAMERVRCLLVHMDVNRGKQVTVQLEDHLLRLATGAIRLATMRDALLMPCLITVAHPWRYTIHLHPPLTRRGLAENAGEATEMAAEMRDCFLPVVKRFPNQCTPRLLASILPRPSQPT